LIPTLLFTLDLANYPYFHIQNLLYATSKKPPGRRSLLTKKQMDKIEAFITASKINCRMSYKKVIETLNLDMKEGCLARALKKRGYFRCIVLQKPPISEKNRRARLA
jgi:hypothetical protein